MLEKQRKTRLCAFSSMFCLQAGLPLQTLRAMQILLLSTLERLENRLVSGVVPSSQQQTLLRRIDAYKESGPQERIAQTMFMDERLARMPIMVQRPDEIEAHYYNVWRRARKQWGAPIRLTLPGLKEINLILDDAYWVCVDAVRYDSPVLAWVDLEDQSRSSLHLPIKCKLNYYHFAASAVRAKSLELMEQALNERLSAMPASS